MTSGDSFVDEIEIEVAAGDGGDGCVSMRREKFVPRGGPNGGDGGRGGDVVLVADGSLSTLLEQRLRRRVCAGHGRAGGGSGRTGRDGEDAVLRVPVGTIIQRAGVPGRPVLADLVADGQRFCAARGGGGGRGNARFATATRQAPDFAEPGRAGERARLHLSLKLLADVGLVGFPNAGKSTLLRRVSRARPRVADYPFTTLVPALGVAEVDHRTFVVADLPGLIEGASRGVGLGDRFLRHVERTRVLVHVLDAGALALEDADLLARYEAIRTELAAYDAGLAERPELVALNKIDLLPERALVAPVESALRARGREVLRVSAATGEGVPELLRALRRTLHAAADDPGRRAEGAS